jgi:putative endonuclease
MYTVYILISEKNHRLYVGCTSDFSNRLERHNKGFVIATKHNIPYLMLYSESFMDKADAFQRERYLKSLWSARFKDKLKRDFLDNQKHY